MLEDLKKNLEQEKKVIEDIKSVVLHLQTFEEKKFYSSSLDALLHQLKMLNRAVPGLLKGVSSLREKTVPIKQKKKELVKLSYISPSTKEKRFISINKEDKKKFLQSLRISELGVLNLKKLKIKQEKKIFNKPSFIAKFSNKFFRSKAEKLTPKFSGLTEDLKKANIRFLTSTYISIAMFISSLIFILSLVFVGMLMIFSLGFVKYIWVPFVLCALSLVAFYFYPSSEKGFVQKKISQELPFAAIHMAAIAGSDVEPTKIFKIIAMSKEYPNVGKEMKKVVNQVEIYGYDLVTALKNISKQTSNKKLAELFSGLATNITSGGELKSYLEKKAENYILDYKLERQKYSSLAGTFMDVYISILIAAPLVLMMMFIVMNVAGLGIGLSISSLLFISIGIIILANIIFLIVLNFKQPKV